jgi:hypothetical protein
MREPELGCSREAIDYWLTARRKTAHGAEVALGYGDDLLTKFLRGKTRNLGVEKLQSLAAYLNVPTLALLQPVNAADQRLRMFGSILEPEDDERTMAEYSGLCAQAEQHWTVHRYLSPYLLHEDHFRQMERTSLCSLTEETVPPAVREAYMERASQFFGLMRSAHGAPTPPPAIEQPMPANAISRKRDPALGLTKSFHRVVAPASFLDGAQQAEWVATTYERFAALALHSYGRLLLSLLSRSQFARLDRAVTTILKSAGTPRAEHWVAINIIDSRYSLVQTSDMTFACYHEGVVQSLILRLSLAIGDADSEQGDYFSPDGLNRSKIERLNARTQRHLQARLRALESRSKK